MTETYQSRLISNGHIYLNGSVGAVTGGGDTLAGFTVAEVQAARTELSDCWNLVVHINSGGGSVADALAINRALAEHSGKVTTAVQGVAAAAGSLIAMAGAERKIAPGAVLMVHAPTDETLSVYAEATGRPVEEIRAEMAAETWLTAEEAIAKGYATKAGWESSDPDWVAPSEPATAAAYPYDTYSRAPEHLVALAKARGRTERAAAPAGSNGSQFETATRGPDMTQKPYANSPQAKSYLTALASARHGVLAPAKPAAFESPAVANMRRTLAATAPAASASAGLAVNNMRAQLERSGQIGTGA